MFSAVVFGYSEVGHRCLQALLDHGVEVPLLFTHEDQAGERRWFGSVAELAHAHGVRAVTPTQPAAPQWLDEIRGLAPDYLLSFYYRSMLPPRLLALPRWGALNMHGSLLPRYRGRAPVNWAIANGETQTGATLHYMVERPDAGPIVAQEVVAIGPDDDALAVSLAVAGAAARVLKASLPAMAAGPPPGRPMDLAHGSYFGGRRPEDGRIDPDWPGMRVHAMIRAVAPPFPGAFVEVAGRRLVFASSHLTGEPVRHPGEAPCLYAADGRLYLDCQDGVRLLVGAVLVDGTSVDGPEFQERFGSQPWRFSLTARDR
ncbi:MAG TPA: formyltransferase [Steroidobacteraceae bacterium]|nr:formyltransferase [Steroidobacteraceae bacterium]